MKIVFGDLGDIWGGLIFIFCLLLIRYLSLQPLIAAEGYFFCLETKEAKIQVIR